MLAEALLPLGKLDPGLAAPERGLELHRVAAESVLADRLGYHAVLVEETKDDPFQVLALAAPATGRAKVGTSVAIAFARSPYVTAMSAWTLQKLSGGRFELGLGSQVRGHVQRRYGIPWQPPGPWMRDYINAVRAIWDSWQTQSPLDFASDHYRLNLTVPLFAPEPIDHPDIPILLAAVNPYMCRVAAEVADGVRLHPVCSARYLGEVVAPTIAAHRRSGDPFAVCLKPLIATAGDQDTLAASAEVARQRLAFYVSTPAYRRPFARAGLEDLAERLAQLSKAQRWQEMATCIDDEVLHEWVVVATHDRLADALLERYGELVDRIEVSIPLASAADEEVLRDTITRLRAG